MSMDDDLTEIDVDLYMRTGQYPSGWSGAIFRQEVGKLALKALRAEERRTMPMQLALKDFLRVAGKDPEIIGIPVYYAEWPNAEAPQVPDEQAKAEKSLSAPADASAPVSPLALTKEKP